MFHILISGMLLLAFPAQQTANMSSKAPSVSTPIKVVKDLNANQEPYIYYDLDGDKMIDNAQDGNWDLAFSKTTVVINSGNHGNGKVAAQVLDQAFELVKTAPTDGYTPDHESQNAISSGTGNGWYRYDMRIHAIIPIPNRSILVKTSEGKYAKLQILSYYQGSPDQVPTQEAAYYTFRYAFADLEGHF